MAAQLALVAFVEQFAGSGVLAASGLFHAGVELGELGCLAGFERRRRGVDGGHQLVDEGGDGRARAVQPAR